MFKSHAVRNSDNPGFVEPQSFTAFVEQHREVLLDLRREWPYPETFKDVLVLLRNLHAYHQRMPLHLGSVFEHPDGVMLCAIKTAVKAIKLTKAIPLHLELPLIEREKQKRLVMLSILVCSLCTNIAEADVRYRVDGFDFKRNKIASKKPCLPLSAFYDREDISFVKLYQKRTEDFHHYSVLASSILHQVAPHFLKEMRVPEYETLYIFTVSYIERNYNEARLLDETLFSVLNQAKMMLHEEHLIDHSGYIDITTVPHIIEEIILVIKDLFANEFSVEKGGILRNRMVSFEEGSVFLRFPEAFEHLSAKFLDSFPDTLIPLTPKHVLTYCVKAGLVELAANQSLEKRCFEEINPDKRANDKSLKVNAKAVRLKSPETYIDQNSETFRYISEQRKANTLEEQVKEELNYQKVLPENPNAGTYIAEADLASSKEAIDASQGRNAILANLLLNKVHPLLKAVTKPVKKKVSKKKIDGAPATVARKETLQQAKADNENARKAKIREQIKDENRFPYADTMTVAAIPVQTQVNEQEVNEVKEGTDNKVVTFSFEVPTFFTSTAKVCSWIQSAGILFKNKLEDLVTFNVRGDKETEGFCGDRISSTSEPISSPISCAEKSPSPISSSPADVNPTASPIQSPVSSTGDSLRAVSSPFENKEEKTRETPERILSPANHRKDSPNKAAEEKGDSNGKSPAQENAQNSVSSPVSSVSGGEKGDKVASPARDQASSSPAQAASNSATTSGDTSAKAAPKKTTSRRSSPKKTANSSSPAVSSTGDASPETSPSGEKAGGDPTSKTSSPTKKTSGDKKNTGDKSSVNILEQSQKNVMANPNYVDRSEERLSAVKIVEREKKKFKEAAQKKDSLSSTPGTTKSKTGEAKTKTTAATGSTTPKTKTQTKKTEASAETNSEKKTTTRRTRTKSSTTEKTSAAAETKVAASKKTSIAESAKAQEASATKTATETMTTASRRRKSASTTTATDKNAGTADSSQEQKKTTRKKTGTSSQKSATPKSSSRATKETSGKTEPAKTNSNLIKKE